jgi:hypothetical protein
MSRSLPPLPPSVFVACSGIASTDNVIFYYSTVSRGNSSATGEVWRLITWGVPASNFIFVPQYVIVVGLRSK